MARWFHALEIATGKWTWLAAADDQDAPGGHGPEGWTFTPLDGEPGRFDTWDGKQVVLDAAAIDADLHAQIDAGAGVFRTLFITDVPGQEMTYVRKEKEGRDYLAKGPGPWPMLEAEAKATGQDVADLAATVVAQADQIIGLGALIEGARMGAKKAVRAATTEAEKRAAATVDWSALVPPASDV